MVEPRVMRVLVALAQTPGRVVSRDELIEHCWDGHIVTDNAVTRVISMLRHALADLAGDAVKVETITKVGFRLVAKQANVSALPLLSRVRGAAFRSRATAIAAAGLALAGFATFEARHSSPTSHGMALAKVEPITVAAGDQAARGLAEGLDAAVARYLVGSDTPVELQDDNNAAYRVPGIVIKGSAITQGSTIRASFKMVSGRTGQVLWTGNFERPASELDDFREQTGMQIAHELHCAYADGRGPYFDADEELARLSMAHCEMLGVNMAETLRFAEQIVKRAPNFARGWAEYAIDSTNVGWQLDGSERIDALNRARPIALRALALDPHQGLAYISLADSVPSMRNWAAIERILDDGLKADPECPELHMWRSLSLSMIGRNAEAQADRRVALIYGHFMPGMIRTDASLGAMSGDLNFARQSIAVGKRYWPQDPSFLWWRAFVEGTFGDATIAQKLFDSDKVPHERPHAQVLKALVAWRLSPNADTHANAVSVVANEAQEGGDPYLVTTLAQLGEIDAAYRLADKLSPDIERDPIWFRYDLAKFRADRRFMPLMARLHIAEVWQTIGVWPDFCRTEKLLYDCRAATAQRS